MGLNDSRINLLLVGVGWLLVDRGWLFSGWLIAMVGFVGALIDLWLMLSGRKEE